MMRIKPDALNAIFKNLGNSHHRLITTTQSDIITNGENRFLRLVRSTSWLRTFRYKKSSIESAFNGLPAQFLVKPNAGNLTPTLSYRANGHLLLAIR